jgi:hypothetical protein
MVPKNGETQASKIPDPKMKMPVSLTDWHYPKGLFSFTPEQPLDHSEAPYLERETRFASGA